MFSLSLFSLRMTLYFENLALVMTQVVKILEKKR